jgi:hypothetical protein
MLQMYLTCDSLSSDSIIQYVLRSWIPTRPRVKQKHITANSTSKPSKRITHMQTTPQPPQLSRKEISLWLATHRSVMIFLAQWQHFQSHRTNHRGRYVCGNFVKSQEMEIWRAELRINAQLLKLWVGCQDLFKLLLYLCAISESQCGSRI